MEIELIEVGRIVEDPDQPRKHHDEESLQGLADSIRQHGVLQPITVTPLANVNMYKIVTGERRWRAAQRAGLDLLPCLVRELAPEDVLTQQLIENLQREDLQPVEKAHALAQVKDVAGTTNRELASRLGISERSVGYLLDLLELPEAIGEQVVSSPNRPADGQVTEKHARFLKQLNDAPDLQTAVVQRIRDDKLTGEQTGNLVKALRRRPEQAEEILTSPTDHLVRFFRDSEPVPEPEPIAPGAGAAVCHHAEYIVSFLGSLDDVRPMNMGRAEVQQVLDALTSLKMAVDGLLRECHLELGESV